MAGRVIAVDARPTVCEVDVDALAVVVVDMQNDFGTPGGMFDRAGIDIRPIQAIVEPIRRVIETARAAGVPVIYLKMAFEADLSNVDPDSPTWQKHLPLEAGQATTAPDGTPSRVLIRDTWNTDIVEPLTPRPGDIVVNKHRYSGFYQTELERMLRERGATTLVVTGATTSVCVDSTVRDAVFRDLHCIVLEDCVAEPIAHDAPRSNHEATLLTLELLFASIASSDSLVAALHELAAQRA
jgi:ureidoacrylate peracid hydrolase